MPERMLRPFCFLRPTVAPAINMAECTHANDRGHPRPAIPSAQEESCPRGPLGKRVSSPRGKARAGHTIEEQAPQEAASYRFREARQPGTRQCQDLRDHSFSLT